ncbi:hypothetical protein D3C87_1656540 [compost metagenome]
MQNAMASIAREAIKSAHFSSSLFCIILRWVMINSYAEKQGADNFENTGDDFCDPKIHRIVPGVCIMDDRCNEYQARIIKQQSRTDPKKREC